MPPSPWTDSHLQLWLTFRRSPRKFVTEVLQANPEPWQAEALDNIGNHDRVSIRAGHGVGKTTLLAWVVLWFMLTRYPFKIPISANSQDQLRDVVWPELRKWRDRLPEPLKAAIDISSERMFLVGATESAFAVARTASDDNPEALQGFHEDNLLFIIEEASGIPDIVFEVAQGALSTPGAKVLMLGNPTRTAGFFYDTHHSLRSRWKTMQVNSETVPRATGHIGDIIAKYGRDSNVYRVRVLGEFPDTEDDKLIPLALIQGAVGRKVEKTDFYPVWGVDVGWTGDPSALAKRRGNTLLEPTKTWQGKDPMQLAGILLNEYRDTLNDEGDPTEDTPAEILIDVIGLGAGTVARCKELELPVRGINVGETASSKDLYSRLRDELWFQTREWYAAKDCSMPEDEGLTAELTSVRYLPPQSNGKMRVEPKDKTKETLGHSPNRADAFILTFAGGLNPIERQKVERYRFPSTRREKRSWRTAV